MAADGGDVLASNDQSTDLLREFFDFGDDLILPDKPFTVKKETSDFHKDFETHFGSTEDQDDFFMGATPSPSSSSTSSSSGGTGVTGATASTSSLEFAMSIANDFMNIDFSGAADVDIGSLDDELDIMGDYPTKNENSHKSQSIQTPEKVEREKSKKSTVVTLKENIQIYTDLGSPLRYVRKKLEKRFNLDLASFTFWLQDSTCLDEKSALSEQCVEGEGTVKVQLNIQPYNDDGHKKINIIDVLKVGPSSIESEDDVSSSSSAYDDESDIDVETDESPKESNIQIASLSSNFIKSSSFEELKKKFNFPASICDWTKFHTFHWVRWMNRTFKGVRLVEDKWSLDGQNLVALSESEFLKRVGQDPDRTLWSHLSILRESGIAKIPSELEAAYTLSKNIPTVVPKRTFDNLSPAPRVTSVPYPKKQRVILGKYEEGRVFINGDESSNVPRTGNNGNNVQLWKFLLDILTDYKHRDIIRWSIGETCHDGEFIMIEPEGVARLWGQQKGKVTMNYEKLSRALRYYKGGNILDKVHNKKFTYRFVCDLRDIVGYSARDLEIRVHEQAERALYS